MIWHICQKHYNYVTHLLGTGTGTGNGLTNTWYYRNNFALTFICHYIVSKILHLWQRGHGMVIDWNSTNTSKFTQRESQCHMQMYFVRYNNWTFVGADGTEKKMGSVRHGKHVTRIQKHFQTGQEERQLFHSLHSIHDPDVFHCSPISSFNSCHHSW